MTRGVGGRTVDLGRILAGERATTVRRCAAIGVNDDLATGQAAVAVRTADDEAARGVDQVADVVANQFLRQHRLDDLLDHRFGDLGVRHFRVVLGRHHHGVDRHRLAVDVLDGDLALRIRAQPGQPAVLAQFALALHDAVGIVDRKRHQRWRLVAGIAEHQALVARALVEVVVIGIVDALGDVGGLLVDGGEDRAGLVVETDVGIVVADATDHFLDRFAIVHMGLGGDFARDDDEAGRYQGFAGDPGRRVLGEDRVENAVRDLVGYLVGMSLGYRFRSEQKFLGHCICSIKQKSPEDSGVAGSGDFVERRRFSSIC